MHAQRQLAVAAVRAEVRRHEVARQALNRLRKLAEMVSNPELRDSIQASLDSVRAVERTHTRIPEIHHAEYLRRLDTHNTRTACSAQLRVQRSPQDSPWSPFLPVLLFLPPPTHTFRSTSLVPLEQVMTTQGGSAAMATPSATSSCPPQPSILWWGPGRSSFSLSTRPHH